MIHSTTFENLFLIWLDGYLRPQPYAGGDSTAKAGEQILFCFPDSRELSFCDVNIQLPDDTPARKGQCWSYEPNPYFEEDGLFDRKTEPETEYHVMQPVKLSDCKVVLRDNPPSFDDFQLYLPEEIMENPYSDEAVDLINRFLEWLNNQERRKSWTL